MPFGPNEEPGYFQDFINDILISRIVKQIEAYLDNIMAYTNKGVNRQQAVSEILEILSKHKLWLEPWKLKFFRVQSETSGSDHLSPQDPDEANQGESSCQISGTKEHQQTPTIHQIFELLPTIH